MPNNIAFGIPSSKTDSGGSDELEEIYKIDYSTHTGFPFYVMGYVPEWFDGVMTDFGANYKYVAVESTEETSKVIVKTEYGAEYYKIEVSEPEWHQYFIADGIPTEIDGVYTVKAMVKASEAVSINVNMGWGWDDGQQASTSVDIPTEWTEVEWEYNDIGGTFCYLVAQPSNATATIEWKWITVSYKEKGPVEWIELLTNGDAERAWENPNVRYNDLMNNYKICAWGKEKGVNVNEEGVWDPFPATIEEVDGSRVFVVHGKPADTAAWDNQFWIESPKRLNVGSKFKLHFCYKASEAATTSTEFHHQSPGSYVYWGAIGEVSFTTEWQDFDGIFTVPTEAFDTWSIAFDLNSQNKNAVDFYFDNISIKEKVIKVR